MPQRNRNISDWTFVEIQDNVTPMVSSMVSSIKRRITGCHVFNDISISLEMATQYCEWHRDLVLWYKPLPKNMNGLLLHEDDVFILVCNSKAKGDWVRAKIILHELGHFLLHRPYVEAGAPALKTPDVFDGQFEKEANLFALIGMIPDKQVDTVCDLFDRFEDRVRHLRRQYALSREEAVWRLAAFDPNLQRSSYREMYERFLERYEQRAAS